METNNKYGYKVCYREYGKSKFKVYLVTNRLGSAIWHIRWYEREPPSKLRKPEWEVKEVRTLKEYTKLWKGCPFSDDLSSIKEN